jgi:hypothetical protein
MRMQACWQSRLCHPDRVLMRRAACAHVAAHVQARSALRLLTATLRPMGVETPRAHVEAATLPWTPHASGSARPRRARKEGKHPAQQSRHAAGSARHRRMGPAQAHAAKEAATPQRRRPAALPPERASQGLMQAVHGSSPPPRLHPAPSAQARTALKANGQATQESTWTGHAPGHRTGHAPGSAPLGVAQWTHALAPGSALPWPPPAASARRRRARWTRWSRRCSRSRRCCARCCSSC